VDEAAVFCMVERMRTIAREARQITRRARRDAERRRHLEDVPSRTPPASFSPPASEPDNAPAAPPFAQIEEW
jgi:putative transposase